MKRLMKTRLFKLLDNLKGTFDPGGIDQQSVYDEFVQSIVLLCTTRETEMPTYFTLNYTRLELQQLLSAESTKRMEKKCAISIVH